MSFQFQKVAVSIFALGNLTDQISIENQGAEKSSKIKSKRRLN